MEVQDYIIEEMSKVFGTAENLVAKFVKMNTEVEDYHLYGDALMHGGVKLQLAFGGTGYNDKVRYFQVFESRIYFMEPE